MQTTYEKPQRLFAVLTLLVTVVVPLFIAALLVRPLTVHVTRAVAERIGNPCRDPGGPDAAQACVLVK